MADTLLLAQLRQGFGCRFFAPDVLIALAFRCARQAGIDYLAGLLVAIVV